MTYPTTLSEVETIARAQAGASLARFGDGEFRLAVGGSAVSQVHTPELCLALRHLLSAPRTAALVCIPPIRDTPLLHWQRYAGPQFASLINGTKEYGSAFVSRPDSAPHIDTPDYWAAVTDLWRGRDVVLIAGDDKSLTRTELLASANSVRHVRAPDRDAFRDRRALIDAVPKDSGDLVLLCLGATATVLADVFAQRGIQALDLGHLGMFMRHPGAFAIPPSDLISAEYRQQNVQLHADPRGFGGDGKKHAQAVYDYARLLKARAVLDYGCGEGTLKVELKRLGWARSVQEYDPAMRGKDHLPKPADLVVCTDVLEHVEPERLDTVLRHLRLLTSKGAYLVIATRPANKVLPDGRNAHLIQQPPDWWLERLVHAGFHVEREHRRLKGEACRDITVWTRP